VQKKVAVLKKDSAAGAFAEEWRAAFQAADIKEEDQVDLAPILSNAALSVKDEKELVRGAGRLGVEDVLTRHSVSLEMLREPPAPS
jgi:nucleosome binding factor SPN SPT16 subunit